MKTIEPTIGAVLFAVLRHWLLAGLAIVLSFALAIFVYLETPPTFMGSTSLLVGQDQLSDATGAFMPAELMNSQVRIAESDEVLRAAIGRMGIERLPAAPPGLLGELGGKLRTMVRDLRRPQTAGDATPENPLSPLDLAVARVRLAMTVRVEPNSSILTISFRDGDPTVAADMANALAESFIDQQNALLKRPGLVDFLRIQTGRFDDEVAKRSEALHEFMNRERAYSIEEQRSLLLKRESDLNADLGKTRSLLADKEGQKHALSRQLSLLEPVARSPFALGFVDRLAQTAPGAEEDLTQPLQLRADDTPPLLMIKVFQDAMAAYRIIDSEIGGLRDQAAQQEKEATALNVELARVTSVQGEYERLSRDVELATFNAETFAKRTVEEQIESDLRDAKLSNVRVIQPASRPQRAVSPKGALYAGFGLAFGILLGVALALTKEFHDINRRGRTVHGLHGH